VLISLGMTAVGAFFAFDLGGISSKSHANNSNFTPWGRRLRESGWVFPNPYKVVGWIFFVPGVALLLLDIASLLVTT
jgi:hypothetical protein